MIKQNFYKKIWCCLLLNWVLHLVLKKHDTQYNTQFNKFGHSTCRSVFFMTKVNFVICTWWITYYKFIQKCPFSFSFSSASEELRASLTQLLFLSAPIIPFRINFGKVQRSLDEDTSASIGPGLGGSPILVDTRHNNNKG